MLSPEAGASSPGTATSSPGSGASHRGLTRHHQGLKRHHQGLGYRHQGLESQHQGSHLLFRPGSYLQVLLVRQGSHLVLHLGSHCMHCITRPPVQDPVQAPEMPSTMRPPRECPGAKNPSTRMSFEDSMTECPNEIPKYIIHSQQEHGRIIGIWDNRSINF